MILMAATCWGTSPWKGRRGLALLVGWGVLVWNLLGGSVMVWAAGLYPLGEKSEISRLSDEPKPFLTPPDLPPRPRLIWEFGDPFLDTGKLNAGFDLPTGAVWQPRLWVFATYRSAVQTFDNGVQQGISEWVNRLDLFANLQLTGTEKLVLGIRPFDRNRPDRFTGYAFEPDSQKEFHEDLNGDIRTFFFEGDLGSLFPNLDREGATALDFGFSVGRQPLLFQEGIMINDTVDSIGLVRNNIRLFGLSNLRATFVYGWNALGRGNALEIEEANMFGLFNSADLRFSTVNLDTIFVHDPRPRGQNSLNIGLSATQRIGFLNTTFRVNSSIAENGDSPAAGDGTLVSAEVSWTPETSDDIFYINPFVAIDNFTQAGREPVVGGPLGTLGILFASPSIGSFSSEINSFAKEVAGVAIGYQAFWDNHHRNLVLEIAGRKDTSGKGFDDFAVGFQLQQRLAQRIQLQIDGHYAVQENRDNGFGARTEILIQF